MLDRGGNAAWNFDNAKPGLHNHYSPDIKTFGFCPAEFAATTSTMANLVTLIPTCFYCSRARLQN